MEFAYEIIKSQRRRRSSAIKVTPDGKVKVYIPGYLAIEAGVRMVNEKRAWIEKMLLKIKSNPQRKLNYINDEPHLFFGKTYLLQIIPSAYRNRAAVRVSDQHIRVSAPMAATSPSAIRNYLTAWYLSQGKDIITKRVSYFASKLGVEFHRITLKRVSSIWGSCSHKGNLNFNRKLVMAPPEIVDYVVLHEVCHLVYHNHSNKFWHLVSSLDPQYTAHQKWLKNNHHLLTL